MRETTLKLIINAVGARYGGSAELASTRFVSGAAETGVHQIMFDTPDWRKAANNVFADLAILSVHPDKIVSVERPTPNSLLVTVGSDSNELQSPNELLPTEAAEEYFSAHEQQYSVNRALLEESCTDIDRKLYTDEKQLNEADSYQLDAYRTSKKAYTPLTFQQFELVHALLGLASEVGELAGTVKKHVIYGRPLDVENVDEETGDIDWYLNLARTAVRILASKVRHGNIAKLRTRYPNEYSDADAVARADKTDKNENDE